MKFKRTKYTHTTPKSQTIRLSTSVSMGDGIGKLLAAIAKVIEKYFGLLYISTS